ncbi:MAG: SIS domain-containing protein [Nocardioides sp.]|uniref:SIS domain-containing protein n=1 Tax=Nocardioides sp. TaxID=35761 RepID=UPI0039E48AF8
MRENMRSLEEILRESIATKERVLADGALLATAVEVGERMIQAYRGGGRVYFCGNGGSAADAQHFAAELTGHFIFDRPPLAAEVLHGNPSHMTAVGNDYDYDSVFARALEASVTPRDVLIAISTSGNSESIVRAAQVARRVGATTVGMTGESGGRLKDHVDLLLNVPSTDTGRIQESHVVFLHAISEHVEHVLFAADR